MRKKERETNTTVTLIITDPKLDGGSDIKNYSIKVSTANGQEVLSLNESRTGVETEALVSDLLPGTNYTIVVAAVNNIGTGPFSPALNVTTAGSF